MPDSIGSTPETSAFAEGWTAFSTAEGLDIILRTSAGESKGRLAALDSQGRLVGSMFEPNDDPAATAPQLAAARAALDLPSLPELLTDLQVHV